MAYTAHPVWSWPPNWGNEIIQRLEWLTNVLSSETQTEQRISRRLTPRRSFEASFLLANADRQHFENMVSAYGAGKWVIPLWHQVGRLTAASSGSTINCDTRLREFVAGGLVYIRGARSTKFEVAEIVSVGDGTLQTFADLDRTWPAGSYVYPARIGRVEASEMRFGKRTDRLVEYSAQFVLTQANHYSNAQYFLRKYKQVPVLEPAPDDSSDLEHVYNRALSTLDNGFGIPDVFDTAGFMSRSQMYRWTYIGREKFHYLMEFLYYLRGRARGAWVPTFMDDYTVVDQPDGEFQALTIANSGIVRSNILATDELHIRIEFTNGGVSYNQIVDAAEIDDDLEIVQLRQKFYTPKFLGIGIRRISRMFLSRLAQDGIEISHPTDVDGMFTVATTWTGPVDASPFYDLTTEIYPLVEQDGISFSVELRGGGSIERPLERYSVSMVPRDGTLTTTFFPISHSQRREEYTVGMIPWDGTLTTTFFPISHSQRREEYTIGMTPYNGTLTQVYFPVNYNNWIPEGIQAGQFSIVGATLT